MDRAEQLAALSGAAADQWGLVTTAQAKEIGLNAVQLLRLTEAGLLENVSRGVYLLTAGGTPRHVETKAAWLRLQPKAFAWDRPIGHPDSGVVSHSSACQLHELGDIPAPDVEITVPRRRVTNEPFVRLRTAPLESSEVTVVDGLPVTTVTRTITDLLQAKADGGHIGGVIAEAERRDLVALDDLAERVQPYARKFGLKATATGRELIEHLVEQAGESLRRQEVDRASREGFDAAVHLLAEHPDLATYLAQHTPSRSRPVKDLHNETAALLRNIDVADLSGLPHAYPNVTGFAGLRKTLQDIDRRLKLNMQNPALAETLAGIGMLLKPLQDFDRRSKLNMQNPALAEALRALNQLDLRQAGALPPSIHKALESASRSVAASQQSASSPTPQSTPDSESAEGRPEAEETD
ncbi:type IV toxin-antitoxin system AbiEi family antitoxin domain-containing protein [Streptomyces sp. AC555_RSS877]|uniref:type IV toxin-antitoxin system AbiEi family antitoxin domain-containing protein n=1 Tax=Streptomyces sp. AC555_RSS877 TaxID=2823688 RepID=UPI001C253088|nr:type IV toxin-antitoxin system AbiEi family antitoxin domain-containing protein [Streptomyces sp. AC555_RSS877]